MNYLEIANVSKYYGKFKALDGVNLNIPQGRIIGFWDVLLGDIRVTETKPG